MKAAINGGVLAVLLQFIGLCNVLKDFDALRWQTNMGVLLIPLAYGYVFNLLLLPIKGRLNKEMLDYILDTDEEKNKR